MLLELVIRERKVFHGFRLKSKGTNILYNTKYNTTILEKLGYEIAGYIY